MNDESERLEQLLLRATAPSDAPPQAELEPEAQPLRGAWLAFGQLLEAAQPPDGVPPGDGVPLLRRSSALSNCRFPPGRLPSAAQPARSTACWPGRWRPAC